ncbi:MAG: SUMF1/EgtB/PvdO family nonheme iron enzyme, partial [Myxococcota bacterium]
RLTRLVVAASALAWLSGCTSDPEVLPPVGNHQLFIDTDAVVPVALNSGEVLDGPALFDRLEVAIFDAEDVRDGTNDAPLCDSCFREFSVDRGSFADGGASLAIVPETGETPLVRVRLFRGASRLDGELQTESVIEVVAELPVTPAEGTVETTVFLPTDAVGVPQGAFATPLRVGESDLVTAGAPTASQVGTWSFGDRRGCTAETPGDDAFCIDGGPYWMGNPLVQGADFAESDQQRLVVLRPFFLDRGEVTVGDFRAWVEQAGVTDVGDFSFVDDERDPNFFCTYTAEPGAADDLPVNCVPHPLASAYCEARGGALPTEAQFEYASGDLRSALFVWGADELPVCAGAVFGRSRQEGTVVENLGSATCLPEGSGPQALLSETLASTRATDRMATASGEFIFDLAGNLQEWTYDYFEPQDGSCWAVGDSNVFNEYSLDGADGWARVACEQPNNSPGHTVRGGSWTQDRAFLRAAYRSNEDIVAPVDFQVGFRCAYPDAG